MYLDLLKAYDSKVHGELNEKLSQYGIKVLPLNLLNSYLEDRRQG